MAFDGNGVFVRLYSWVNDAAANIKIRADRMDNEMNGFATGLSTCITKDGQTNVTANLPMAGFRHTGVGDAVARSNYASFGQVQDGKTAWADAGGTADAITASYSIPITTLVDGQLCYVRASAANATTTPTFSPSALTARTIVKNGGQALVAGDIAGDGHELILRYDLANTRWELLNPFSLSANAIPYTAASSSGSASLQFAEDTDNGSNYVRLTAPASIAANVDITLPGTADTIVGRDTSDTLTNKTTTSLIRNGTETGTAVAPICQGRLTLTTNVPVTTTDVTGATNVYFTPCVGNKVALYTGSTWAKFTFTQLTLALGTLTSARPYDVFLDHNSGTPQLVSLAWTNDTTRATALAYQDGVLVKSGTATQRYLGTFYTTSTTTTEDSVANRYLWNYYNRVDRPMLKQDATASWSYSTAAFRQANNSTANRLNFVIGVSEDAVTAQSFSYVQSSTTTARTVITAVGLDSTSGFATGALGGYNTVSSALVQTISCNYRGLVSAGRHYLAWLEYGAGTDTQTWYGSASATGINGIIKA